MSHKFSVRLRLGVLVFGACVVAEFQISIPRKISDTPQKDVIIVSQSLSRSVIAHTLYIECGIQKWHLHQIPHAIPNWRCCVCRICLLTLEFWMNSGRNAARIANATFVFHFNLRYSFLFVIVFVFLFFCLFCICRLSFIFFTLFFSSVFVVLLSLYFCVFFWGGSANKF